MSTLTLLNLINLRGMREQMKFATGEKGKMKQCYCRGCVVRTPLFYALRGNDLSEALHIDRMHSGEIRPYIV